VLNNKFCVAQPTVLKASTTPTPVSPVVVEDSSVASICDVFRASSVRPPTVVVKSLSVAVAFALLSTVLVTAAPLPATTVPVPNALPPEASATLSPVARIVACSNA